MTRHTSNRRGTASTAPVHNSAKYPLRLLTNWPALTAIGTIVLAMVASVSWLTGLFPRTDGSAHTAAGNAEQPARVVAPEACGALQYGADGNAGPVLCPDGRPNLALDRYLRRDQWRILLLGPNASPIDVQAAVCADISSGHTTLPIERTAYELAHAEENWHFGIEPTFDSSACG